MQERCGNYSAEEYKTSNKHVFEILQAKSYFLALLIIQSTIAITITTTIMPTPIPALKIPPIASQLVSVTAQKRSAAKNEFLTIVNFFS